ncbi:MarR family winged helix-turn-helix transcriptional regulator [Clostridium akagii]|uniref:MarR family winged helix-turn-helix transcriptional regulator n=1 Tax=Clostridium akagii TaxID=91623 RepID=UPI00047DB7D8|nr:MarR family transcriptional regulator [Clostridium akagii]
MNYDMLKLDNQLCFALYACSREITKHYKPELDKLGITYTQYVTLMVLWEKDNITVKELGSKLHLDSGTLTPLLKKLEAKGIVTRARDSQDERNVYVSLTESGVILKDKAIEIPKKMACIPDHSPEQLIALRAEINNLLGSFEKLQ